MNFKDAVRTQFTVADFMVDKYLADLTQSELLTRPAPDANHIAWQLGHLISAETRLIEAAAPGSMPACPTVFTKGIPKIRPRAITRPIFSLRKSTSSLPNPCGQRRSKRLDAQSESDLDRPVTGRLPPWIKCAGDCFVTAAGHWVLHAGQWVVLRRKLGRERQF